MAKILSCTEYCELQNLLLTLYYPVKDKTIWLVKSYNEVIKFYHYRMALYSLWLLSCAVDDQHQSQVKIKLMNSPNVISKNQLNLALINTV